MPYIEEIDRKQLMICSLDSMIEEESLVRIIDKFIESLDIQELGIDKAEASKEGRPSYNPRSLLKLYIYGYRNTLRSSRKLARECQLNIEVKWLMKGLQPDFRTISDFRKNNVLCLKKVFNEFNKRLETILFKGYQSVDGSKFQACNSKDRNFTLSKLDDKINRIDINTEEYIRLLEQSDEADEEVIGPGEYTRGELEKKLAEMKERKKEYEGYLKYMEENNLSQLSLTDPEAKLMKSKNDFMVAYNVQTAIDSETHIISDYQVTDNPTDHGLILTTVEDIKKKMGDKKILEVVADKGYVDSKDMVDCFENGIVPHVIPSEGHDIYELETEYEGSECDEETRKGNTPETIRQCLKAGIIPEPYQNIIDKIEVYDKQTIEIECEVEKVEKTEDEMKLRAAEGFFVRNINKNCVYCPAGETLRQKSVRKNGSIRYANRVACKRCKHKCQCTKSPWKELDLSANVIERENKNWPKPKGVQLVTRKYQKGRRTVIKKMVRLVFRPDRHKMINRKCLSEHPFGTIKRAMHSNYFLLKGKEKVGGEFALFCLGYNLQRAVNLLGYKKVMGVMG